MHLFEATSTVVNNLKMVSTIETAHEAMKEQDGEFNVMTAGMYFGPYWVLLFCVMFSATLATLHVKKLTLS